MAPLGLGLIGLGRHGLRYAQHLLRDVPEARLVAVCRRTRAEGERFSAEHGLRFYADYRELAADPEVQAGIVATPPATYEDVCLELIARRKPMLVEKPLATTGRISRTIVEAAAQAAVPVMTAQTLRFEAAVLALKARGGEVGPPASLSLTSRVEPRTPPVQPDEYGGRGVLLEIGVHLLDLVRFLTEDEVVEVRCELAPPAFEAPETRAWAWLKTARGVPCLLEVSRLGAGRTGRAEWVGPRGQVLADWVHHRLQHSSGGGKEAVTPLEGRPTLVEVLRQFVSGVEQGTPLPVTGLDGQRAVEIADACYESAETGKIISLQD